MDAMTPAPLAASTPKLPLATTAHSADQKAADQKTARDFEAVFIGQMTQLMMESVPSDGDFSGGHGEAMFRGVLAEKLGGEIAKRGGIGIAPAVLDQIIKLQGGDRGAG